jgi:hypothetical protein
MSVSAAITANEAAIAGDAGRARLVFKTLADAVDAHCPVLDLFANATPVQRRLAVTA